MKKLLMVAVAATALTATPAMANNSVNIQPTATVAPICVASAQVATIAGGARDQAIGYNPDTQSATNSTATSNVNLAVTGNQLMASITARCNTSDANYTIDTANGFKLKNGTSEIPYSLNLSGSSIGTFNVQSTARIGGTGGPGGSGVTRSLNFVLASAVNPLNVAPGTYQDTVTITITPFI